MFYFVFLYILISSSSRQILLFFFPVLIKLSNKKWTAHRAHILCLIFKSSENTLSEQTLYVDFGFQGAGKWDYTIINSPVHFLIWRYSDDKTAFMRLCGSDKTMNATVILSMYQWYSSRRVSHLALIKGGINYNWIAKMMILFSFVCAELLLHKMTIPGHLVR